MRPGRKLAVAAGVLAALAGAVWLGAYLAVPVGVARLEVQVQRTTGRALTIQGTPHISLSWHPGITVDGVTLANAPGGSRVAMLTTGPVTARLDAEALLHGQVIIESVTIAAPDLLLETLADGSPNWRFARQAETAAAPGSAGAKVPPPLIQHVAISDAKVQLNRAGGAPFAFAVTAAVLDRLADGGNQISVTLPDGEIKGTLSVAWQPRPRIVGALAVDRLDLDTLIRQASASAPAAQTQAAPQAAGTAPGPKTLFSDRKLGLGWLRLADTDLQLSAGSVIWNGATWNHASAHIVSQDGVLAADPLQAEADGGIVTASLHSQPEQEAAKIEFQAHSAAFPLALAATLARIPGEAAGKIEIVAKLAGEGDSPRALANTASGKVTFSLRDGSAHSTMLDHLFGEALRKAGLGDIFKLSGRVAVSCLIGDVTFANGQGTVRNVTLDTSRLSVTGSGSADLPAETVALRMRALASAASVAISIPFEVAGPITAPRVIIAASAKDKLNTFNGLAGVVIGTIAHGDSGSNACGTLPDTIPVPVPAVVKPVENAIKPPFEKLLRRLP